MEASKVSIRDASLHDPLLSEKKKRELRIIALTEYIRTAKYGKVISPQEFKKVGHFGDYTNAGTFVRKMARKWGILDEHPVGKRQFFYTVRGEVQTKKVIPPVVEKPTVSEKVISTPPIKVMEDVEAQAMRYLWHYPDGDVRSFIKWLKSQKEE